MRANFCFFIAFALFSSCVRNGKSIPENSYVKVVKKLTSDNKSTYFNTEYFYNDSLELNRIALSLKEFPDRFYEVYEFDLDSSIVGYNYFNVLSENIFLVFRLKTSRDSLIHDFINSNFSPFIGLPSKENSEKHLDMSLAQVAFLDSCIFTSYKKNGNDELRMTRRIKVDSENCFVRYIVNDSLNSIVHAFHYEMYYQGKVVKVDSMVFDWDLGNVRSGWPKP